MPKFKVSISCQLEGVTNLEAPEDDFQYQLKLECNSCNEMSDKWQYVSATECHEMPGSRGTFNYIAKCKLCSRVNSLDVVLQSKAKYTLDDVPKLKEVIHFECRGLTVRQFRFGGGWRCEGTESRTPFENLDLDEYWCDYDEEAKCPVGITELRYDIS